MILKAKIILLTTGFIQCLLVVANTYFIANNGIVGIWVAGFFISYVWSHNVRKVAFGNEWDRITYATGAMLGSVSGFYLAKLIS